MDTVYDLVDEVHQLTDKFIARCEVVSPSQLGLYDRSAYHLFVMKDAIACEICDDGNLQYYGGFDQIDAGERMSLGEYVVYLRTDENRIDRILEHYYKGK